MGMMQATDPARGRVIYLDMDGVVVDIVKGVADWLRYYCNKDIPNYNQLIGRWPRGDYEMSEQFGVPEEEMWWQIERGGVRFWRTLPCYDSPRQFYYNLKDTFARVIFLSTPGGRGQGIADCLAGKMLWLQDIFGLDFKEFIFTSHKEQLARHDAVLIDDSAENCKKFVDAGGHAIVYPRPWNNAEIVDGVSTLQQHVMLGLKTIWPQEK